MAPPPPATLPLAERLKALAQTLQYVVIRPLCHCMQGLISVLTEILLQVCLVCWVCPSDGNRRRPRFADLEIALLTYNPATSLYSSPSSATPCPSSSSTTTLPRLDSLTAWPLSLPP